MKQAPVPCRRIHSLKMPHPYAHQPHTSPFARSATPCPFQPIFPPSPQRDHSNQNRSCLFVLCRDERLICLCVKMQPRHGHESAETWGSARERFTGTDTSQSTGFVSRTPARTQQPNTAHRPCCRQSGGRVSTSLIARGSCQGTTAKREANLLTTLKYVPFGPDRT